MTVYGVGFSFSRDLGSLQTQIIPPTTGSVCNGIDRLLRILKAIQSLKPLVKMCICLEESLLNSYWGSNSVSEIN